jgi:transposase
MVQVKILRVEFFFQAYRGEPMSKEEALKENGTFNRYHKSVKSRLFGCGPFFDARDLVQVKYEMLREVSHEGKSVTQAAKEYGLSREAFYKNKRLFEKNGLTALIPKKTGPKGPHKLANGEEFINGYLDKNPDAKATEIAAQLELNVGIKLHPVTISRYLNKKKHVD